MLALLFAAGVVLSTVCASVSMPTAAATKDTTRRIATTVQKRSTRAPSTTAPAVSPGLPAPAGVPRPASASYRAATAELGTRLLASHPGNQVVSPISISAALTLLSLGAGGETRRELETVLGLATDDQQRVAVAQSLGALGAVPSRIDSSEQIVRLANALWVQKGIALKPSFTATMRDRFGAPVRKVDFAGNPKQAIDAINAWASAQTNGHIPKIFEQLDPSTVVVLANALYAKLTWLFEANPIATTPQPFTRADGTNVQAPTMTLGVPHGAAETVNGIDMVSIPYRGDYEMVVAATSDPTGLAALDRPLTGEFTLIVRMPRFESRSTFDLLTELGPILPHTFGPAPDLTGMGLTGVFVDQAVHKAWTKTDEKGTEGAAVTAVVIAVSAPPPKTIVLDKSFTYIVRHRPTGLILFMGRVDDPTAAVPAG